MALDIGGATYGYDVEGTKAYLDQIKAQLLDQAAEKAKDTTGIDSAVDDSWAGQAADDFKTALAKDANDVASQLGELYLSLQQEINNLASSMADVDNGLLSGLGK